MISFEVTLTPHSVKTLLLSLTCPFTIHRSASLLEQSPALAITLAILSELVFKISGTGFSLFCSENSELFFLKDVFIVLYYSF